MNTATLPVNPPSVRPEPFPAQLFAGWLRVGLYLLLLAVPAGIVIHLIAAYAVDVPFWDQWETARFFSASRYGHESIVELARQQNESRLLFPNLIFLALSLPGNWSVVREMYFDVALVAAVSAVLFQLLRRTGFSLPVQAALLFAINWLLFAITQQENWLFGIQICYYLVPTALCFALLANVTRHSLAWKTLVSLGLAFVAAYSFSGGVLICALAFPGFLPSNWSAAGRWLPSRREALWHTAYVVASAIMLTAYFWNYLEPAGAGSLMFLFRHPEVSLGYFFAWFGSPLFPREPIQWTIVAGVCAFVLLAGLLGACCFVLRHREEQRRLYPWIMLAGYAVGTGMVTVIGRSGFGLRQAISSRYISFSSYAYIVILVLGAYLWCFHRRAVAARVRVVLLAAGLLALTAGGALFTEAQLLTMPGIVDSSHSRNFAKQGLTFMPLMPSSQNLDALCGVTEYVREHAMNLLRSHILAVPVVSASSLREAIQHVSETGDPEYGELDQPDMDASSRVSIRGWAVNPHTRQPAGDMLITCTGSDGVTHPLVVLVTDIFRPDEAPAAGDYQKLPCAFMGLTDFDRLAPGEYRVAAWVVDTRLSTAHQIGLTYLFKWERPGTLVRPLDAINFPALVPQQDNRYGALESARTGADGVLDAQGWAVDVNSNVPAKAVLLTCTGAAGVTRVVGHVGPGEQRKDVADLFHNDSLMYCGFKILGDLSSLPPGKYQVAAWGVNLDEDETIVPLGGSFPVQVPPK